MSDGAIVIQVLLLLALMQPVLYLRRTLRDRDSRWPYASVREEVVETVNDGYRESTVRYERTRLDDERAVSRSVRALGFVGMFFGQMWLPLAVASLGFLLFTLISARPSLLELVVRVVTAGGLLGAAWGSNRLWHGALAVLRGHDENARPMLNRAVKIQAFSFAVVALVSPASAFSEGDQQTGSWMALVALLTAVFVALATRSWWERVREQLPSVQRENEAARAAESGSRVRVASESPGRYEQVVNEPSRDRASARERG